MNKKWGCSCKKEQIQEEYIGISNMRKSIYLLQTCQPSRNSRDCPGNCPTVPAAIFYLTYTFRTFSQNERKLASPYMAKLEINPCHRVLYDCVILCHCTLAAALYFERSSCDELMEFKHIQTRAQPEESLKHNHRQVCATMVMFE